MHDGDSDAILFVGSPGSWGLIALGIFLIILMYYPLHQWALAASPNWLYESVAPYVEPFNEMPAWRFLVGGMICIALGSGMAFVEIRQYRRTGTYNEVH